MNRPSRSAVRRILAVLAAVACAGAGAAVPTPDTDLHRASQLIGQKVEDARGWEAGEVLDFLVDPQTKRIAFVVLTVGGRFQQDRPPVALKIPTQDLTVLGGGFRTRQSMEELDHLPALSSAIEDVEPEVRSRLRSVKALLSADLTDAQGRDIGGVEDVIMDLAKGYVRFVVANYDPGWLDAGKFVAVHDLQVRGAPGQDLRLVAEPDALHSTAAFRDARWPALSDNTVSGRLNRWTSFN